MPSTRIRRLLVLTAGYIAATASAAVALVLYGAGRAYLDQSGQSLAQAQTLAKIVPEGGFIVALVLAICLPVAWIPLAAGLALWHRVVGRYRLLGCVVVGTFTGALSNVWLGAVVGGASRAMFAEMVTFLAYAAPMGAFGGLVFWATAFRGSRRPESRTPSSVGRHGRRGASSQ